MKKVLFLDRDGTIILEPKTDYQVDRLEKFKFFPKAITSLARIASELDYELVMVTNQDGLGTSSFPEKDFWPLQELMMHTLKGEGVTFHDVLIDRSFEADNSSYRKPGTGMFSSYLSEGYDLENSFVIGDRWSDAQLAKNLGAKSIFIHEDDSSTEIPATIGDSCVLKCTNWDDIYSYLKKLDRRSHLTRSTNETSIDVRLNLDGTGLAEINTGLAFFDHMLTQIAKHGGIDLVISTQGDLEVDEHHTIEDTAIALGSAFKLGLAKKIGIHRYGFYLPMDDCLARVALDFGGRPWLVWDASFTREKIGDVPTEMFYHFFKSFVDNAECNLNIKCEGDNEHHKIESIFKAFARAIRQGKERDVMSSEMPSTKGSL